MNLSVKITGGGFVLKRRELAEWDRRYLWHPFTQMSEWMEKEPLFIESGEGIYLFDTDGNRYIDSISSVWLSLHGHGNRRINEALTSQIERISHSTLLGLSNIPSTILAKKLVEIVPEGLERVFYSDNGSTAVEIALKMAFQYWHQSGKTRKSYVSLANAYHGDTIGAVSVGGIPLFHSLFKPLLFSCIQADSPYCYRCHRGESFPGCSLACLDSLEEILTRRHSDIAALVIEPVVQAATGMLVMPPGYLREIRRLCTEYDVFLIADEVATGFGRTGRMFACEHDGVSPDFLCLSKGLTGGYIPLGATLTTPRVFEGFLGNYEEQKTFYHGHSYTGNQLGCAAALANLEIFEEENVMETLVRKADFLGARLEKLLSLRHVGEVRQRGLMVGIELVADKESRKAYDPAQRLGVRVCEEILKMGMISRPLGNILQLVPPYISTEEELSLMVDILFESIKKVTDL